MVWLPAYRVAETRADVPARNVRAAGEATTRSGIAGLKANESLQPVARTKTP
jgi:hypothetical protein